MKSFKQWREEWNQEDYNRKVEYASLKLDFSNIPSFVEIYENTLPNIKYPRYIKIEFTRRKSYERAYVWVIIPYLENNMTIQQAKQLAYQIIKQNANAYSNCSAMASTARTGTGFYHEETDREYFQGNNIK